MSAGNRNLQTDMTGERALRVRGRVQIGRGGRVAEMGILRQLVKEFGWKLRFDSSHDAICSSVAVQFLQFTTYTTVKSSV